MRDANPYELKTFTKSDLFLMLSRVRKKPMTDPTFYRWLDINGISPKHEYSYEESKQLMKTAQHFARGGKRENYNPGA